MKFTSSPFLLPFRFLPRPSIYPCHPLFHWFPSSRVLIHLFPAFLQKLISILFPSDFFKPFQSFCFHIFHKRLHPSSSDGFNWVYQFPGSFISIPSSLQSRPSPFSFSNFLLKQGPNSCLLWCPLPFRPSSIHSICCCSALPVSWLARQLRSKPCSAPCWCSDFICMKDNILLSFLMSQLRLISRAHTHRYIHGCLWECSAVPSSWFKSCNNNHSELSLFSLSIFNLPSWIYHVKRRESRDFGLCHASELVSPRTLNILRYIFWPNASLPAGMSTTGGLKTNTWSTEYVRLDLRNNTKSWY